MRHHIVSNPLHEVEFKMIGQFEAEIISSVIDLFNGDRKKGTCGALTSGGTESILLSILAHREYAKKTKGVTTPNLVIS